MELKKPELKKLSPWNWLRKESAQPGNLPTTGRALSPGHAADPLVRFHDEIDRMFGSVFGAQPGFGPLGAEAALLKPDLDISETDEAYKVSVEIPGVESDDVQVSVEGGALLISGEKQQSHTEDKDSYHCVERSYGRFQRILDLPADADDSGINARFDSGVLNIEIPRRDDVQSKRRSIEVKT